MDDRLPAPRLSLIVPAHNEAGYLPSLLDTVDIARSRYAGGQEAVEVIVADNDSTDATAAIAREHGCRVVPVSKRVIAAARNAAAAAARGMVLAFVDADTRIHPGTFDAIEGALATGRVVAGATGVTLERWSAGLATTYAAFMPLVWLTRMDTGVVFCLREDFETIGGYDETRLVAEDVQFLWDLRRLGRTRGQRLARLTSVKAIASTRKFDRHGDWHYFTHVFPLAWKLLASPSSPSDFVRHYWYEDR
jgi:glycosyltransferase involved in cell wall biosynthesis